MSVSGIVSLLVYWLHSSGWGGGASLSDSHLGVEAHRAWVFVCLLQNYTYILQAFT